MIPILNSQNDVELHLILGRKILRFLPILKSLKLCIKFVMIHRPTSPQYQEIKSFIENIFYRSYHAKISVNFPKLMALTNRNNKLVSAVGVRNAADNRLFLEQYLDQNIEEILSGLTKSKVERSDIVEIGSLASSQKNAAQCIYIALSAYLKNENYKYAVMTGTEYLLKYFKKAGLKPQILAKADRSKLIDKNVYWGTYYETNPKVMVLDVANGYEVLNRFLGIDAIASMTRLYPRIRSLLSHHPT